MLSSYCSSSRSTKLTVDMGSLQSVSAGSGHHGHPGPTTDTYSHVPTASYTMSLDEDHDGTLTAEEATQYLELSDKPERCRCIMV